jgi:hypothetical protein
MIRYVVRLSALAMVAAPALAQSAGQAAAAPEYGNEARKVEEIVVTGVREDSFPNGVSREAVVGVFGQRLLLATPITIWRYRVYGGIRLLNTVGTLLPLFNSVAMSLRPSRASFVKICQCIMEEASYEFVASVLLVGWVGNQQHRKRRSFQGHFLDDQIAWQSPGISFGHRRDQIRLADDLHCHWKACHDPSNVANAALLGQNFVNIASRCTPARQNKHMALLSIGSCIKLPLCKRVTTSHDANIAFWVIVFRDQAIAFHHRSKRTGRAHQHAA